MSNTYAINVTRGKEFDTEAELQALGLHPWLPRRLASKYVKERRAFSWYDRPYVGKLIFCVIPAIYWPDVRKLKHVIGKPEKLSRLDMDGHMAGGVYRPGLKDFEKAVAAEYADAERQRANAEYQCQYTPGQALTLLRGPLEGLSGAFREVVKRAHDDYPRLKVAVDFMGRPTLVEVDPDHIKAAE